MRRFLGLQDLETSKCALLLGFIKSLDDDSNTAFVTRILSIVAIEISHSLLLMFPWQPVLNKVLNLSDVHKLNIIHMSVLLSLYNHIRRHAFVAHCLRISLMILTRSIDFIPHFGRRKAVIAFDISWMHAFALEFALLEPVIEGNVSGIGDKLLVEAVDALCVGAMLTKHPSNALLVLKIDCCAVQAFSARPMVAFRLIISLLLLCLFSLLTSHTDTVQTLPSRWMVAFRSD